MCEIFGISNNIGTVIDRIKFATSAKLMQHRGPNAHGQWGRDNQLELGHFRLSIVDLKPERNQPFFSQCKKYVIVFNGEIYNYVELRYQLEDIGYTFRTESGTEVLLTSYLEWG